MDRYLKQLGEGYSPFSDDRGSGYRRTFPTGGTLTLIRGNTIPSCPNDKGWVAVSEWAEGGKSANYYPSFRQMLNAINAA